jgi:hypothetical protein
MVEFADVMSVTRALTIAAKKKSKIGNVAFRIYKAGTGTFLCTLINFNLNLTTRKNQQNKKWPKPPKLISRR